MRRFLPVFQHYIPRALLLDSVFGGQVTSWYRDQVNNDRVGGAPHSQHLLGFAYDVVPPDRVTWPSYAHAARSLGMVAVVEDDHIHVQFFPAGTLSGVF